MREKNVPEHYIDSCKKIKYMFPKGHAAAYVMMALRVAWFKVYRPLEYYATFYTVRADNFDAILMLGSPEELDAEMNRIDKLNKFERTAKDDDTYTLLELVYEMRARGIDFLPVDLYKSCADEFLIQDGKIRPPFNRLPGVGGAAAETLYAACKEAVEKNKPFISVEDLKQRAGAGSGLGEVDEGGGQKQQRKHGEGQDHEHAALRLCQIMTPLERVALVQEEHAREDAAHKAGQAQQRIEVAARQTQDHAERAAEEHQRADHNEHAEKEADHRGRAAAALEFLRRDRRDERAEQDADDLRTEVLHDLRAVQTESAGRVAQEAGDAEAHVAGVAVRAQNERRNADHKSGDEDQPVVFQPVAFHNFSLSLSKLCFNGFIIRRLSGKCQTVNRISPAALSEKQIERVVNAASGGPGESQ